MTNDCMFRSPELVPGSLGEYPPRSRAVSNALRAALADRGRFIWNLRRAGPMSVTRRLDVHCAFIRTALDSDDMAPMAAWQPGSRRCLFCLISARNAATRERKVQRAARD
jgi:hypothetical protein